jgi:hypothetical protein
MDIKPTAVAIIPCHDLEETQQFFGRLGFQPTAVYPHKGYRILHDTRGASVHLTQVELGWVVPERNAHGVYLYSPAVISLAEEFGLIADIKPWGLTEFSVSDPNGLLVRVGWPTEALSS